MTNAQRSRELAKISGRISELLGDYEDSTEAEDNEDGTGGEADLVRLKEGISGMAGALKKKALMRVAFLQSAHISLSKQRDTEGGADEIFGAAAARVRAVD